MEACISMAPKTGGSSSGKSNDEVVDELAQTIEASLPGNLLEDDAGPTTFMRINGLMDSLGTVLGQEMIRFNKLLGVMRKTLKELQMAIRGETLMSDVLDSVFFSLLNNLQPPVWTNAAYPSLKPLSSWVNDLHAKLVFMDTWVKNGQPDVFWMAGFFFPQGFMTGALQKHSRKYEIAIDRLNWRFQVHKTYEAAEVQKEDVPTDGVLIQGLFMDGARWSMEDWSVMESYPGELFNSLPIIHFMPDIDHVVKPGLYETPVYKTSTRAGQLSTTGMSTNYVLAVELPTKRKPTDWILKGVAALTQLDD